MMTGKKTGFWARIFGGKKSGCCNLRIEELDEEIPPKQENEARPSPLGSEGCCAPRSGGKPGCCG